MELSKADELLLKAITVEETKKALEMGANPNARDKDDRTVLMRYVNDTNSGQLIISYPHYIQDPKSDKERLARLAVIGEQAKLLIEAGADVNATNGSRTALRDIRCAEHAIMLLKAGATHIGDIFFNSFLSTGDKIDVFSYINKEATNNDVDTKVNKNQVHLAKTKERLNQHNTSESLERNKAEKPFSQRPNSYVSKNSDIREL